jgi:hypothetical protein
MTLTVAIAGPVDFSVIRLPGCVVGDNEGDGVGHLKRVMLPVAIFVAWLTVVGLGVSAPRYSPLAKFADLTLLAMHLGLVAFLSLLVLHDRWHDRHDGQSQPTLLRRIRGWITDDRTLD